MAIKSLDEILGVVRTVIGENNDDNSLTLLDDISDTFNDLTAKTQDNTNWEEKYNQLDKEWRERYKARFFGSENDEEEFESVGGTTDKTNLTFDSLFTE